MVYSFTRVEPVSRGGDPGRGLAATVQDPFWMLARQRQFGELTGEDAGSPVQATFVQTEARFDGWTTVGGAVLPYSPVTDVLEAVTSGESAGPAHSTLDRLQAGRALAAAVPTSVAQLLRVSFPLTMIAEASRMLVRAATMFADGLAVAAAIDGVADGSDAEFAAAVKLPTADANAARADLTAFAAWCRVTFGTGPNSWIPDRLERRFGLAVSGAAVLATPGHTREQVDWYDFDVVGGTNPVGSGTSATRVRVPTVIQFPGQARNRFWEFEDSALALSRIDAATTDLGRLALVEFSTVYGNDWFTFPIPVTYGSMQALSNLVVRDTFGRHELIAAAADRQWAMYRPTGAFTGPGALVVPAVTLAPLAGDIVEQVRFLRDEMANFVWGVEQIVTDADGNRRDLADEYVRALVPAAPTQGQGDLAYRLMTEVPEHWVPFIPVHLPGSARQVGLIEAVLPRPHSLGQSAISNPRSSVLQELRGRVIPEEEIPTAGLVVRRRWFLARSADGGRHAWAARSVATGRGEGASGLRFDVAEPGKGYEHG